MLFSAKQYAIVDFRLKFKMLVYINSYILNIFLQINVFRNKCKVVVVS